MRSRDVRWLRSLINEHVKIFLEETDWWKNKVWYRLDPNDFSTQDVTYERYLKDPTYAQYFNPIASASDLKSLKKAKKELCDAIKNGEIGVNIPDSVWTYFYEKRKNELKNEKNSPYLKPDPKVRTNLK